MGKKKSVVFTTLITIVILVLCAVVALPTIGTLPGTNGIKTWRPAVMQYDLGAEFGGGHYAYYYPNGVITETEYDALEDDEKTTYTKVGGLYMSNDEDDCILTADGKVDAGFQAAFDSAVERITDRFAARAAYSGSTYRVSVVNDYAIRVDISATERSSNQDSATYAYQAIGSYANMGELSFEIASSDDSGSTTTEKVDQLTDDVTVKDLIKSVSVKTRYKVAFVKMTFTSLGKEMLEDFKSNSSATSLNLVMGDTTLMQITTGDEGSINTKNEVEYGVAQDSEILTAHTLCALIESALDKGGVNINDKEETPLEFNVPTSSELRTYEPVYGDFLGMNTLIWVYLAVLVVLVIACALAIVKMGGFGVMNAYVSVFYTVVVAFCYRYITTGVFAFGLPSVFVYLAGLAIINVINAYIYRAIREEVKLGKTVQSSVKGGYKKTLWAIVDIYAVLLLGAVALLVAVAGMHTVALQAIICIVAAAFGSLLMGRFMNLLLLSASKDKYKYFRFVREEDDDDE